MKFSDEQPPVRLVVMHRPGPAWQLQLGPLEQTGVAEHFEYLASQFAAGKIHLAGPFLLAGVGGMVLLSASCTEADARHLVDNDPGVKSGLIAAQIYPWMTTLGYR